MSFSPVNPSYLQEHHEFILGTASAFQTEEDIIPENIQDGFFDDGYFEFPLTQMEADYDVNSNDAVFEGSSFMEFDSVCQDAIIGFEDVHDAELGHGSSEDGQKNVDSLLKEIQEELMDESSLTDLLLTGAEAVEAENWVLASTVIAKLNSLLFNGENEDNPFNRLAFYFTQGLHYKSINSPELPHEPITTEETICAFHMLQEISPFVKFAHFTANQAILEATQGDQEVNIIDFDITEGFQWPPLMVDLALRKPTCLRITAIITDPENADLVQQTGRRLKEFADSINIEFRFEQMVMLKEEDFEQIELGSKLIANCMIHQLRMVSRDFSLVKTLLGGVSKLSPKMVVLVEEELFSFAKVSSLSFVEFFCEAFHHYSAISDSLVSGFCGGYKVGLRLIENEFLRLRIMDSVRQFPREKKKRDVLSSLKAFKPVPVSFLNISQAKVLVGLFCGGYWVQYQQCRLALCWKSRPLTTASIWVPISNSNRS